MFIRVPLILSIVDAVINRIDTSSTRAVDPPGAATSGYDDAFREPIVFDTQQGSSIADRTSSRVEQAPIRVPCQVETTLFESLAQAYQGNLQQGEMAAIFHVKDLQLLNLIDTETNKPNIGIGDRISTFEKHNLIGVNAIQLADDGMYVREIYPASFGFGDSYDLWVCIITSRDKANL